MIHRCKPRLVTIWIFLCEWVKSWTPVDDNAKWSSDLLTYESIIRQTNSHYSLLNDTNRSVKTSPARHITRMQVPHLWKLFTSLVIYCHQCSVRPQEIYSHSPGLLEKRNLSCCFFIPRPHLTAFVIFQLRESKLSEANKMWLFIFSQPSWNVLPSPLHTEASHCPGGNVIQLAQYT